MSGRLARGAVLAGASALAACSGGDGPAPDASVGATDANTQVVDAGEAADAAEPVDAGTNQPDAFPPMPYGAPPKRNRIV